MSHAIKVVIVSMAVMMATACSSFAATKKGRIFVSDEREVLAACDRTPSCQVQSHEGVTIVCSRDACTMCRDKLGKCYTPADNRGFCPQQMIAHW
jgi:hypothetical protein